jgi:hypothetical protein
MAFVGLPPVTRGDPLVLSQAKFADGADMAR